MPAPPSLIRSLQIDPPLAQNANYKFDANDRAYIDDQARGAQQHLVQLLINGVIGTWYTLDSGSVAVIPGDLVCLAGNQAGSLTKAVGAALTSAGMVFGIVLIGASPGGKVQVAKAGAIPPSITGLAAANGNVYCNTSTARCQTSPATTFFVGNADAAGFLNFNALGAASSANPVGPAGGDLSGSYPNPQVAAISGASPINITPTTLQWLGTTATPTITQQSTSGASGTPLTIQAQGSTAATGVGGNLVLVSGLANGATSGTPGNVVAQIPAPTGTGAFGQFQVNNATHNTFVADNQGVVLGRTDASQFGWRFAPLVGSETAFAGAWVGPHATAPNSGNYDIAISSTTAYFGGNSATVLLASGQTSVTNAALTFLNLGISPSLTQNQQANGSNPNNFVIAPQAPGAGASTTATGTPGSLVVNLAAPVSTGAEAAFVVQRNGTNVWSIGTFAATPSFSVIYANGSSGNNYTLLVETANSNYTILNSISAVDTQVNGVTNVHVISTGVQLCGATTTFGGGNGVLGVSHAIAGASSTPSGGHAIWSATDGMHVMSPVVGVNQMFAAVPQGTWNTQKGLLQAYCGACRTTTTTATTVLTIGLPTSGSTGSWLVQVTGRDVTSGVVGDGVAFLALVLAKNVAGTVTLSTTQAGQLKCNDTSMATCSLTFTVSSTNILAQVNGLTSVTIDWTGVVMPNAGTIN